MESAAQKAAGLRRMIGPASAVFVPCLVLFLTVRHRFYLADGHILLLYAAAFLSGLVLDLKGNGFHAGKLAGPRGVQAALFLLSVIPMLWYAFGAWAGLYESYFMAGTFLPFSDAYNFVVGAKKMLAAGELNAISALRPLGPCLFALLLAITDHDYQQALILLVGAAGVATFFAARETWLTGGLAAAVIFIALATVCMAPWLPLFMTETPGYTLGCLGYAYLLNGFRRRSFGASLGGLGLFTLGMMTRPGAILAVPLLALYMLYFFRKSFRGLVCKGMAVAIVCGAAAGVGPLMLEAVGPEGFGGGHQGNAYYAFYGLASGGKEWDYVLEEHPELMKPMSNLERDRAVKELFKRKFAENPWVLIGTSLRLVGRAVLKFPEVLYPGYPYIRSVPLIIPGFLAFGAFLGLIYPAFRRRGPWVFLVPCVIGVFLSFPIIPIEIGLRRYAASFPLTAALAACAVAVVTMRVRTVRMESNAETVVLRWRRKDTEGAEDARAQAPPPIALIAFSALMVAALSVLPLLPWTRSGAANLHQTTTTPDGKYLREIVFYHNPRSGVLVGTESRLGNVVQVNRDVIIRSDGFGKEKAFMNQIHAGDYLCDVFCFSSPHYLLFDGVPEGNNGKAGYIKATVRSLGDPAGPTYFLYRVEDYIFIDP